MKTQGKDVLEEIKNSEGLSESTEGKLKKAIK